MIPLNLPPAELKFRKGRNVRPEVFDMVRNRFVTLTPEEWVRQHVIHFLVQHKHYPASLMSVEVSLSYNRLRKRSDIIIYNAKGQPRMIIECKAPDVEVTEKVLEQAAMYNRSINVPYLFLTNGMIHHIGRIGENGEIEFLRELPDFEEMVIN
jgi:hypothetical protein